MVLSAGMTSIRRAFGARTKVVTDLDNLSPPYEGDGVVLEQIHKNEKRRKDESSSKLKQFLQQFSFDAQVSPPNLSKRDKQTVRKRSKSMYERRSSGRNQKPELDPPDQSLITTTRNVNIIGSVDDSRNVPRRSIRSLPRSKSMCERTSTKVPANVALKETNSGSGSINDGGWKSIASKSIDLPSELNTCDLVVPSTTTLSPPHGGTSTSTTDIPRSRRSSVYLLKGRKSRRRSSRYAQKGEQIYIVPLSGRSEIRSDEDDFNFEPMVSRVTTPRGQAVNSTPSKEGLCTDMFGCKRAESMRESSGRKQVIDRGTQRKTDMLKAIESTEERKPQATLQPMLCLDDEVYFSRLIHSPPVRTRANREVESPVIPCRSPLIYDDGSEPALAPRKRAHICPFTATVQTYGVHAYDRSSSPGKDPSLERLNLREYTDLVEFKIKNMACHPLSRDNMDFHLNSVTGKQKTMLINLIAGLQ